MVADRTYDAMYPERVTVQELDTGARDTSGGVEDSGAVTVLADVPAVVNPVSAQRQADFALMGFRVTDVIETPRAGVQKDHRVVLADGRRLTVHAVKKVAGLLNMTPTRYEVLAEEVRTS
jgi:hypothetical protein